VGCDNQRHCGRRLFGGASRFVERQFVERLAQYLGQDFDNQLVILALRQTGDSNCANAASADHVERKAAAVRRIVAWINRNALFERSSPLLELQPHRI